MGTNELFMVCVMKKLNLERQLKSIGGRFVIVTVVVVDDIAAADGTTFCGRCVIIHRRVRIGICCLLSLELVLVYSNP